MTKRVNRQVTVYVDDKPRRFFLGLRVRHAFGHQQAKKVERGELMVTDDRGSRVDLDGALYDGERLHIVSTQSPIGQGWGR